MMANENSISVPKRIKYALSTDTVKSTAWDVLQSLAGIFQQDPTATLDLIASLKGSALSITDQIFLLNINEYDLDKQTYIEDSMRHFSEALAEISPNEAANYQGNQKKLHEYGKRILKAIDDCGTEQKAVFLANASRALANRDIDKNEYFKFIKCIQTLTEEDLEILVQNISDDVITTDEDYIDDFRSLGLLKEVDGGFSYTKRAYKFVNAALRYENPIDISENFRVNNDTIYLNHIITCINQKIFEGLNNQKLRELGKKLKFYPGVPEIFKDMKDVVAKEDKYKNFSIQVEHYIVSTGITEMIKGSIVNEYVDGIWGCEFIEKPIRSNFDIKIDEEESGNETLNQIGYIIDNTSKTRAIFEINKGSNKFAIDVNSKIAKDKSRIPFTNMIYIADGPSDIPVFSILKQYGGKTFAIYPKGDVAAFNQVNNLIRDGRIDMFAEADYTKGTQAYIWLTENVKQIAEQIYNFNMNQIINAAGKVPHHIID